MPIDKISFLFLLTFCFQFFTLSAQTKINNDNLIVIDESTQINLLGKSIYYLEDKDGNLSFEDILKPSTQTYFKKHDKNVFVKSASSNTYWLKLSILNQSNSDLYIEVGTEYIWYLDYYIQSKNYEPTVVRTGAMRPEKNRPYPVNKYWFKLPKDAEIQQVYFRLKTGGILEAPIQIGTLTQLHESKTKNDYIFGGFIGLMIIMFGYNLFLFLSTKEKIYGIYVIYIFTLSYSFPFTNNYPFISYLLGEELRHYWYAYFFVWVSPSYFLIGLFAIVFLDLRLKLKPAYYTAIGFIALLCIFIPICNLSNLIAFYILSSLFQLGLLLFALFLLILGLYLWIYKKEKEARFYTLAWVWIILGTSIVILTINGYLPYNYVTRNATFFGTGLDILFFSLALVDKINTMKREKDEIISENLSLIEEQKEMLEIQVAERTEQIQKQKEDIEDSILYAQRIQLAILPIEEEIQAHLKEFFILFRPKSIVSGDFYYFQAIRDKIILAVVDCTGHGVPGAFMSMLGKEILDNIIIEKGVLEANHILDELHKGIRKALKQDQNYNRDGMDLSLLVIDKKAKSIEFSGAKNQLVYISEGKLEEIKGDKMPIGGEQIEQERSFTKHIIPILDTPTNLYIYSDGYQDQFGGVEGKKFTKSRLKQSLLKIHSASLFEQKEILEQDFIEWINQAKENQLDDVLVMGIKI